MKTRSKLTSHKGKQVHREKQPLESLLKNNSNTVEREKPKEINKMTNISEEQSVPIIKVIAKDYPEKTVTNIVFPPMPTEAVIDQTRSTITKVSNDPELYLINIPHTPNPIRFVIRAIPQRNMTSQSFFYKREGGPYTLETRHPIFDNTGNANAILCTEKKYKQEISQFEPTVFTESTLQDKEGIIEHNTVKVPIKHVTAKGVSIPTIEIKKLQNLRDMNQYTRATPLNLSQRTEIVGKIKATPPNHPGNTSTTVEYKYDQQTKTWNRIFIQPSTTTR